MTMTKTGITEVQPDPNDIKHPNWPFRKVALQNPYNTPPDQRFAHNCRSKREPIRRTVLNDADLSWQGNEKTDKGN